MLSAAACSSDDGGGTVEPTPTIGVSVATPTVTVVAGQSGTAAVTVTRGGGYTGAVNLTVEGSIPAGTATPNPAALATGVTASTITVTTGSATPAGTYNLTVRAAGTGAVAAVTTPLTVTVTAPVVPGFTIAPAAALTVTQGAGAQTATINITRTGGFAGAVTLATSGTIPAGLTLTPAAASTGNTMTIAVSATTAVAPGTYPITITATGAGVTGTQTTTLNVTVATPQATPDFSIANATVSVVQGASGNATIDITRAGGFTGAVTLTTSGTVPAGLTLTPGAASTTNSGTIAVAAASTLAPGTYPITVSATGAGVTGTKTATLTVTVTAAQATPDFSIAASAVSVAAGATTPGTSTVTITRTGGFAGAVTVTTTGAPSGLTVTPPAATTGNTAALSITAVSTLAPGTYPITVSATGAGVTGTKTTTFNVTVTPAVSVGDFTVAVSPTTVTLQQGQTATVTATITRTGGFAGAVDVTVTGLPTGVAFTVAPTLVSQRSPLIRTSADPITGNTAVIRLTASTAAPTGPFTFNVVATASGIPTRTTAVSGTLTAASTGGGGNVGLNFCASEAPLWVGFQNDGGAWQRATIGANNQVQVNITGARGAIAYVTATGASSFQTSVIYGTATELNGYGSSVCNLVTGGKTHTGTVVGVTGQDQATVTLGSAVASPQGGTFTLNNVPPGPRDLLAVRSAFTLSGSSFSITPNKVVLRRDVNQASGTALAPIDFGSSEAFDPASALLTVSGLAANESVIPFVSLQTATGTSGTFYTGFGALTGGGTGPQTYYGLPADRLRATDYHLLTAIAFVGSGTSIDQTQGRITAGYFRTVAARTLTLSAALGVPTVSIAASTPYPRPRVQLARQADYGDAVAVTFSQASGNTNARSVAMTALASYLQGGSTWDLTFPDLSTAPGFDVNWALRTGTATTWTVAASGGTGVTLIGQVPTEGSAFRSAFRTGTITTLLRSIRR